MRLIFPVSKLVYRDQNSKTSGRVLATECDVRVSKVKRLTCLHPLLVPLLSRVSQQRSGNTALPKGIIRLLRMQIWNCSSLKWKRHGLSNSYRLFLVRYIDGRCDLVLDSVICGGRFEDCQKSLSKKKVRVYGPPKNWGGTIHPQALRKKSLVTDNSIQNSNEPNKTCKVRGWMEYRLRGRLLFEKGLGIAVEGRFVRACDLPFDRPYGPYSRTALTFWLIHNVFPLPFSPLFPNMPRRQKHYSILSPPSLSMFELVKTTLDHDSTDMLIDKWLEHRNFGHDAYHEWFRK